MINLMTRDTVNRLSAFYKYIVGPRLKKKPVIRKDNDLRHKSQQLKTPAAQQEFNGCRRILFLEGFFIVFGATKSKN